MLTNQDLHMLLDGMLSSRLVREASEAASTPGFYPGVSQCVARAAAPAVLPHLFKTQRVRRADSRSHKTTNPPCSHLKQHRQHLPAGWGILAEHLQPRSTSCPGEVPVPANVAAEHSHRVTSARRSPSAASICPWICSQTNQLGHFQGRRAEGDDILLVCRCQCSL